MFRTNLLSIIRSLYTVFTETGICHTSDFNCLPQQTASLAFIIRIYHDALSCECQIPKWWLCGVSQPPKANAILSKCRLPVSKHASRLKKIFLDTRRSSGRELQCCRILCEFEIIIRLFYSNSGSPGLWFWVPLDWKMYQFNFGHV